MRNSALKEKTIAVKYRELALKHITLISQGKVEVTEKNNASVSSHILCPLFLNKLHDPMYDVSLCLPYL